MKRLDETQIIKIFQKDFGFNNIASDDVEFFNVKKKKCVVKTDTFVESTDMPNGMKMNEVARKSIVACISDFSAKGVIPKYAIISVTIPKNTSIDNIRKLSKGFSDAAKEFRVKILGGDTNEGKELVITCSMFGEADHFVKRTGVKNGDFVFVTGEFGLTKIGLHVTMNKKQVKNRFRKIILDSIFFPKPRLTFGSKAARFFSASMDSSDGLSSTLNEIAKNNRKQIIIGNVPTPEFIKEFSKQNGLNYRDLVFNGGEEYEIIATCRPENFDKIKKIAKKEKIKLTKIGIIQKGKGVIFKNEDEEFIIKDTGWKHFS